MKNYILIISVFLCGLFVLHSTGSETTEGFLSAVVAGDVNKVTQFVKDGADVNMKDKDDIPLLVIAAEKGHLAVLRVLLDHGALPSNETEMGDTALIRAAAQGHEEIVLELISRKSDINHANMYMDTALATAVRNDHTNIVKVLLKHNADVNIYHVSGYPLLCSTMLQGNMVLVKILIDNDADVNLRTYPDEQTMLMLAVISGAEKQIEDIMELGVDIDAVDKKGYSALMHAVRFREKNIVEKLISLGANLNKQDNNKRETALLQAVKSENERECELLIHGGADHSLADLFGGTPLMHANAKGNKRIVDLLISAGAKDTLFTEYPKSSDAELTLREVKSLDGTIKMWFNSKQIDEIPKWSDISSHLNKGSPLYLRKGLDVLGNQYILGSRVSWCGVNVETIKKFEEVLGGKEKSKIFWGKYMP